ncbi:RelA/SpoT domain-containing protein, partial [Fusobacterium nucleatum]|uniref:RelA/SpoT domain-containing protein n=3 Tax=Fusobacterium TaxID=848 RepID=UPI0018F178F6
MEYTISKINKIGVKIKESIALNSDEQEMFNYFRKIHELIFEKFYKKVNLSDKYTIVTRLKRMESIINKLQRPNSSKLSRIDDIAGIRIIVNNFNEIYEVSELLEKLLIGNNCQLKYNKDYIKSPKKDGYRSLHKIFTFNYENKNLNFEIQIRTKLQHLWSTTVEIYDLIEYKNLKSGSFNKLKTWEGLFFKRCSKVMENFEKEDFISSKKLVNKIFT